MGDTYACISIVEYSVFTKHNWDIGMGYLWLNGWGIYHLMGGTFMAYWVGHLT